MSNLTQQMLFDRLPLTHEQRLILISAMEEDMDNCAVKTESKEEKDEERYEEKDESTQQTEHSRDYTSSYNPVVVVSPEFQTADSLQNL